MPFQWVISSYPQILIFISKIKKEAVTPSSPEENPDKPKKVPAPKWPKTDGTAESDEYNREHPRRSGRKRTAPKKL